MELNDSYRAEESLCIQILTHPRRSSSTGVLEVANVDENMRACKTSKEDNMTEHKGSLKERSSLLEGLLMNRLHSSRSEGAIEASIV